MTGNELLSPGGRVIAVDGACVECQAPTSTWTPWHFKFGHCSTKFAQTGRDGARGRRAAQPDGDERAAGHHPGLGYVSGRRDLQKKVDAALRAGHTVRKPEECFHDTKRPSREGAPTEAAIDRVKRKIARDGFDG